MFYCRFSMTYFMLEKYDFLYSSYSFVYGVIHQEGEAA